MFGELDLSLPITAFVVIVVIILIIVVNFGEKANKFLDKILKSFFDTFDDDNRDSWSK